MSDVKDIYIIGASGFGREVLDTIIAINKEKKTYNVVGFIDDNKSTHGESINDIEVKGDREFLKTQADKAEKTYAVIAIAEPKIKELIANDLDGFVTWENIIHPTAIVSDYASIGEGSILQGFIVIGPNTTIGNHCLINARSGIGHDVVFKDFVSIMSLCDITGNCILEERVYVATSVSVIPSINIGSDAYLCAGSTIFRDVDSGATVIGNPAKRVK